MVMWIEFTPGFGGSMTTQKERVALGSIVASGSLTLGKAVVGVTTGSLAILSEAAHSLIDLAATVMTYFAVRMADKPADRDHQYGHGKIENIAALAETALLFILSGVVMWESAQRLIGDHPHAVEATAVAFGVIIASIAVDFYRARALNRVAVQTSSPALEADALHFSSDMWSSAAVLHRPRRRAVRLPLGDSAAAMVVALFVCLAGWRLGRRTIDALTDTAPEGVADRISAIARKVGNVASVERVRTRQVGGTVFGEIDVGASRTLPLDRIEVMKEDIGAAVRTALPNAEIGVNVMPRALDNETVMERVMVIARNRGFRCTTSPSTRYPQASPSRSISRSMAGFRSAPPTRSPTAWKRRSARRSSPSSRWRPISSRCRWKARPAAMPAAADVSEVGRTLSELAAATGTLRNVHEVRMRDTDDGRLVVFHCNVDPARTVSEVHELVDELERGLRRRFPAVKRVIGHAEPRT